MAWQLQGTPDLLLLVMFISYNAEECSREDRTRRVPPRTMMGEGGARLRRVHRASLQFHAGRRRVGHRLTVEPQS
ncbi:hypothetical protein VPH35_058004 [Triticum aestivum]